ncbi:MAG TPA: sensor histidine kinase [Actinomycetota bacterium]|nr:sensor histidine kinase [Actinomycetota bacterium]
MAVIAVAATSLPLLARRRSPAVVLAVVIASVTVAPLQGFGVLVAFYSVGAWTRSSRRSAVVAAVGALATVVAGVLTRDVGVPFEAAVGLAIFAVAWYLGVLSHVRRRYTMVLEERARSLEAEREADRRRAAVEERTRIARELHDIVAHRVSLMTVQAGAAGAVMDTDPRAAREAIGAVETAGRDALAELRQLVSVLRTDDEADDPLTPDRGLSDVPQLAADMREAGLEVEVRVEGEPQGVGECLDSCSYRIVQEALTNVLKHAGPHAEASVTIRYRPQDLQIEVVDTGDAAPAGEAPGYGIIGMSERAAAFGGSVHAGPRPQGGFEVRAQIPLDGSQP